MLLISLGAQMAFGQADDLPPQVIGVRPFPGEEIPAQAPLEIIFNQEMDRRSVEGALQFTPPLTGQIQWIDGRTARFFPEGGWPSGQKYEVTLGTTALAENGLPLADSYAFTARTAAPLLVTTTVPADGGEGIAAAGTKITIAFNRPVVALVSTQELDDLPQPLSFTPPLAGSGQWLNTSIYEFTPATELIGGAEYTVTVGAGLTDVVGSVLAEDYTFRFKTLGPEILSTYPEPSASIVPLEAGLSVNFSQAMNQASVEENFRLLDSAGQAVEGSFEWPAPNAMFFKPAQNLQIGSTYQFILTAAAQSEGGAPIKEGRDFSFSTVPLPFIAYTFPEDKTEGVQPSYGGVSIQFGTPMNPETMAGRFLIEPAPAEIIPYASSQNLYLQFDMQSNTDYAITILAGIEDIYGNAIGGDYRFSFRTGEEPPYAYIPDSYRFVVTGGYREDSVLPIQVAGSPTLFFGLYNLPVEDIPSAFNRLYQDETLRWLSQPRRLVREWSETFETTSYRSTSLNLVTKNGGALPLGTYFLLATFPQEGYTNTMPVAVGVVNTNVTYKRAKGEVLVWVTDMQSGAPLADQNIKLYVGDTLIAEGKSDADGLLSLAITAEFDDKNLVVVSESVGRYGFWYANNAYYRRDPRDIYLYTDRPIYRPGETLYFKGVMRNQQGVDFSTEGLPEQLRVIAQVNYGQERVFEGLVTLNEFGSFTGEIVLADTVPTGELEILLTSVEDENGYNRFGSITARIAEFRVPEFQVNVSPAEDEIFSSDPTNVLVNGKFFSGGALSNAKITWYVQSSQGYFAYTGPGNYSFADDSYDGYFGGYGYYGGYGGYGGNIVAQGEGQTDSEGNLLIALDSAATANTDSRPAVLTLEATASDESGQFISGRASFTVHPSQVYVGVATDRYFGEEGEPLSVNLITVDKDSSPLAGQAIALSIWERRWERTEVEGQFGVYTWTQNEYEVVTAELTSDAQGRASYSFTPPTAGRFVIRASSMDLRERVHRSSRQIWVTGTTAVWWGEPSNALELQNDKDEYVPGDIAEILIPVSLEGKSWLLVTLERDGLISREVIPVEGSTYVYRLPITEAHAPTVHVDVVLFHGIDEQNPNPVYRRGSRAISVDPAHKRLSVTLTPSVKNAQPGETVEITVEARNPDGSPAQAELSLVMTDAAILTLAAPNSGDPESHYYSYASRYVITGVMLENLIDGRADEAQEADKSARAAEEEMATDGMVMNAAPTASAAPSEESAGAYGGGGGGGPGFADIAIREDFQQTPLWAAQVVTNSDGLATVEVTLPDNLTIWNLSTRAFTLDTKVGAAETEVNSTLPLLVRPAVPRFFVVGDEVTLAMVVNNNSGADQTVQVKLEGTGFELLDGESLEKAVAIPADGRARVEWGVTILDVPGVDLTFFALGEDGYQDAAKPALRTGEGDLIPVYRYTAPDTVGTAGVLREEGAITEGISIPPYADTDQGTLTLQLDPSLAVTTIDALDYLRNFEHQCIEQTVSRFLPNVINYRALKSLGVDAPELEIQLREQIDFGLKRLSESQNLDGGWGWFQGMDSSPYITAYAVWGLSEIQNAGYDINPNIIERAMPVILGDIQVLNADSQPWKLNRQAFYFFVLSRYGNPDWHPPQSDLDALFELRLELSHFGRAHLLMAYHSLYPEAGASQIEALQTDLISSAKLSATGAHWEEDYQDWWNWNTDLRTTGIVLSALTQTAPDNPLLPNAVRWLMVGRQGTHWETTQDTVWGVISLTDWMLATNELQGNYDYQVALNSAALGEGQVTPDTVRQGQTLTVEVGELLLDEINRVSVIRGEGEGVLYYTAHLRLRLDASEAQAIDRGVKVSRQYFIDGQEGPVTEAQMGQIITVQVTLNVPETIYYFVLTDPIPAGTEVLDTSLLTTTRGVTGPDLSYLDRPNYWWWWGWWVWDHTEIRDEGVNLYADELNPGTYVYTYQIQATAPGRFQTMPSHAYAFYFPEVFGRGDGTLFTVTAAE
jgi:hypothetical protein